MGTIFLPDRLRAGAVDSAEVDGAGGASGDDGGVTKFSSKSVGVGVGGSEVSGTSEVDGTEGTLTGESGAAGTSWSVLLAVTGSGGGCAGCET